MLSIMAAVEKSVVGAKKRVRLGISHLALC